MKLKPSLYKYFLFSIIISLIVSFFYQWFVYDEMIPFLLLLVLPLLLSCYRYTDGYFAKNALGNLIKRNDDKLDFSRLQAMPLAKVVPQQSIAVERISTITASNNMLSIILDGNGNGVDFYMIASNDEIIEHLRSLLSETELDAIEMKSV
ncbi:hypothetical protein [Psychrobium sp. 1_MG-2023]|uniref:hypothetical protein n=1 Tax=Psychrobium sp. 1_MG-2023 TaxID=3062624 RepID=UPI000C34A42E|nr:hypothetical protein [Psychrobium sp. 1_MG-2023]MDP2561506.1 hypothetical protein [Psychrobium sp. 1_MG-2023]PKF57771.1 hypothetical protein CW748_06135 [Alteromonadales bacterium alter-6D02]